ncbi:MAG: hypothetical protein ACM3ML_15035, partial [Micromonosporaceae bacterium]
MDTAARTTTRMNTRTVLSLPGVATLGCCAGGLLATLLWTRTLTAGTLAQFVVSPMLLGLGLATAGLVLALRRSHNPIGWLSAGRGSAQAPSAP